MIRVIEVEKSFGAQVLFRDVSFSVNPGEKVGLVGRNGHGKSTLLSLLAGTGAPDCGRVVIPKQYRVATLEQRLQFTEPTVSAHVCAGLPEAERDNHWLAAKVLAGLGFSPADLQRPPREFSGGFQIRMNLARMLLSGAEMLLLDEPNNYLDVVAVRWLRRFLQDWRGEFILVTHDRCFMDSVVGSVIGIHRQRVRKITGTTGEYYRQLTQEETVYEKSRQRQERKRQQTEQFVTRFRAKARQAGLAQSRLKMLAKQEPLDQLRPVESLEFSFSAVPFHAPALLEADAVAFRYQPDSPLLFSGVNIQLGRKERIAIVGKNGKGKTTLLRVLAGELAATAGTVKLHPELRVGYFGQTNIDRLNPSHTVLEEVMSADSQASPQRARNLCGMFMFTQDAALKPVSVLSGGERSRVLLAKIIMQPCHALLLDEPTNHLDMDGCEALLCALESFDGAVIIVTHEELFLRRLARKLIVFEEGGVRRFDGSYDDFLARGGWHDEATAEAPAAAARSDARTRKREQAEIRQERSRVLAPLERHIARQERDIAALEAELEQVTAELIHASEEADAVRIAELARRSKELPPRIDAAYGALEAVLQEYEAQCARFSSRLQAGDE